MMSLTEEEHLNSKVQEWRFVGEIPLEQKVSEVEAMLATMVLDLEKVELMVAPLVEHVEVLELLW